MNTNQYDVLVIGAGAASMMAAKKSFHVDGGYGELTAYLENQYREK